MKTLLFLLLLVPGSSHFPAYGGAAANTSLDIGNNFWEIGSTPLDPQTTSPTFYWPYYNFSASVSAASQQSIPDWLTCGDNEFTNGKGMQPQSILSNTDSCSNALNNAAYDEENGLSHYGAFDTMQWYIRHCYPNANAAEAWSGYNGSWSDTLYFPGMRDAIFNFVLYGLSLRSDDEWFCLGVPLLQVKFVDANDNINFPACRAIDRFLMDNPRCAWNYDADSTDYSNLLRSQWHEWSDTSHRGEVFDSTIPTLHDLGLDTLLSFASVANYTALGSQIILDAKLEGNPTDADGMLWLSIGREAYLHIGVYDLLGQQVQNAGYQGTFEQGAREVPLGLENAPQGTYYIRIQTANNETRTLKLVKE